MRLIDADRLLKTLEQEEAYHSDLPQRADGVRDAIMDVMSAPAVDAVPVVRCKDCKWRDNQKGATEWMPCRVLITPNNFYCASGKRKDGGDGSTD